MNGDVLKGLQGTGADYFWDSGLGVALNNYMGPVFAVLNYYYYVMKKYKDGAGQLIVDVDKDGDAALSIATAISGFIGPIWSNNYADLTTDKASSSIKELMREDYFNEVMRRLPGFLAMVAGEIAPLLDPAKLEKESLQARAESVAQFNRLKSHLSCNRNYYVQQFLRYTAEKTNNQSIVDFVVQALRVMGTLGFPIEDFDPDRSFIDKQEIIVPSLNPLTSDQVTAVGNVLFHHERSSVRDPDPMVIQVEVPCDGIHLEVAEGACQLNNVPPSSGLDVDFSVQNAKLAVTA